MTPFLHRWSSFVRERFPLLHHVPMACAFFTGNALLALRFTGTPLSVGRFVGGAVVTLLVFFRLRLFDEIKDYETDRELHADRPLARGLIPVREARWMTIAVAAAEAALVSYAGTAALLAWSIVLAYSLLMFREFFVGSWMRPKMELYAVTHTLVASGIGLLGMSLATHAPLSTLPQELWIFLPANWFTFNVFEFARKTWGRDEEKPGIDSYSKRLTPLGAVLLSLSQVAGALSFAGAALRAIPFPDSLLLLVVLFSLLFLLSSFIFVLRPSSGPARLFRTSMTLFLLVFYVSLSVLLLP